MFTLNLSKAVLTAAYAATVLGAASVFTLSSTVDASANSKCGGLNQRVCKKWEQLRGCDKGLHRTSPIGGICTRDNKLIPDFIEDALRRPPRAEPTPERDAVAMPPPRLPGPPAIPAPHGKKGALPHLSSIPATQPSAMDGLYRLAANGVAYKLEAGRFYAMADYMHLFVFPVETYDVVVKDILQTGPGQLSGSDLALLGPWTATLTQNGSLSISVQGALGPFASMLTPIQLDDPEWFAEEMAAMNGGGYDADPQPGAGDWDQPPADDWSGYPPGWGG